VPPSFTVPKLGRLFAYRLAQIVKAGCIAKSSEVSRQPRGQIDARRQLSSSECGWRVTNRSGGILKTIGIVSSRRAGEPYDDSSKNEGDDSYTLIRSRRD
jgi:hypothetical protein